MLFVPHAERAASNGHKHGCNSVIRLTHPDGFEPVNDAYLQVTVALGPRGHLYFDPAALAACAALKAAS